MLRPVNVMYFAENTMERWLARVWPSREFRNDPLLGVCVEGRYAPIPIAGWKLIPWVAESLSQQRIFRPLTFSSFERLTVIIPVRDRDEHLRVLVPRLTELLTEQSINHRLLVCEQESGGLFNKGVLFNAGLYYGADWTDYYCLHDVDAVPITANYLCPSQPLRLVTKLVDSSHGDTREPRYFGGAITVRREQVFAANGFSNEYWGWGKEDDDFFFRLLLVQCLCYADTQGTFYDLPNPPGQQIDTRNALKRRQLRLNRSRRSRLMRGLSCPQEDGINSLRYEIVNRTCSAGYERILVRRQSAQS